MGVKIFGLIIATLIIIISLLIIKENRILKDINEIQKEIYCNDVYGSEPESLTPNKCLKYFK